MQALSPSLHSSMAEKNQKSHKKNIKIPGRTRSLLSGRKYPRIQAQNDTKMKMTAYMMRDCDALKDFPHMLQVFPMQHVPRRHAQHAASPARQARHIQKKDKIGK